MLSKYGLLLFILSLVAFVESVHAGTAWYVSFISIIFTSISGALFVCFDNEEDDKDGE